MESEFLLSMKGINKSFLGVNALIDVDFHVRRGEVHALMGENGAGKSTLMKVLTGIYVKDSGTIEFDGKPIDPHSAIQAQQEGISTIYQELNLVPYLRVYENLYLGRELKTRLGTVDRRAMIKGAQDKLESMGIHIDVDAPLHTYGTAVQQMISIARALMVNAKLVVMDEPTSSLDKQEVNVLFALIRDLAKQGISVIFISHRLEEVFQICESVTILRNGEQVGYFPIRDLDVKTLVSRMIGHEYEHTMRSMGAYRFADADSIAAVRGVHTPTKLKGIDVEIKEGEIVGLAGLLGSGRTELAKVLFGADAPSEGGVYWMGREINLKSPRDAIHLGMGFCTEDRKVEGILPHLSVAENITVTNLGNISKFGVINRARQNDIVSQYIQRLKIKTPSPEQTMRNLSGGNQQKVLLARWLCINPRLLILDEPTRGIDVGTKMEIELLIRAFAKQGISILMISSEMEELVRNCDRVVVMRDGKKVDELVNDDIDMNKIMDVIAQAHALDEGALIL